MRVAASARTDSGDELVVDGSPVDARRAGDRANGGPPRPSGFSGALAERDSTALEPRQRLFYLFSLQQRTAEARAVLWQMYQIRDDPRILVDLVLELLLDQQDVRGLAPELEQFVAKTPEDPFLRRAWGMDLLYQGRASEALPHLEAAAGLLENDPLGPVRAGGVPDSAGKAGGDRGGSWDRFRSIRTTRRNGGCFGGESRRRRACWSEPSRRLSERWRFSRKVVSRIFGWVNC